jgi:hypothetical protein
MNMPGFTAEASLYKASEHYHAAIEGADAGGSIYPAQLAVLYEPPPPWAINSNPYEIYCRKLKCWGPSPRDCRYVIERC